MKIDEQVRIAVKQQFGVDCADVHNPLLDIISQLKEKKDLKEHDIVLAMCSLMSEDVKHADIASYLSALHEKGETELEIAISARVMRLFAKKIYAPGNYAAFQDVSMVDCCGTGGGINLFNVSTMVAIILAAAGLYVAKHGNRAITSQSGSADFLEALGIDIMLSPEQVGECILQNHIGFLFAPLFHAATKNVQMVRKQLPHKTIFNILGPLTNPANPSYQLIGVYDPNYTERIARVLHMLGLKRAMVVHGDTPEGGMDEVSTLGRNRITELLPTGEIRTRYVLAGDVGLTQAQWAQVRRGNAVTLMPLLRAILAGKETGPEEEIVALNAGCAFVACNVVETIEEGIERARAMMRSGACSAVIERWVQKTNALRKES